MLSKILPPDSRRKMYIPAGQLSDKLFVNVDFLMTCPWRLNKVQLSTTLLNVTISLAGLGYTVIKGLFVSCVDDGNDDTNIFLVVFVTIGGLKSK